LIAERLEDVTVSGRVSSVVGIPPAGTPDGDRKTFITIRGLKKSFDATVIYDQFDLDLPQGEFISIFGPNGCGKSTLINMISGLMPMDAGQVLFDGQTIQETRLSYVFQNYRDALFPWLRAIDNIHYPLKLMGLRRHERDKRVEQLLSYL
jgi:NitT/TauT family transport system ATP-binding protein